MALQLVPKALLPTATIHGRTCVCQSGGGRLGGQKQETGDLVPSLYWARGLSEFPTVGDQEPQALCEVDRGGRTSH